MVVLALYINSGAVQVLYTYPWLIWPLVPIVLYIIIRVWILAHRRKWTTTLSCSWPMTGAVRW
ncbi:hypothetical protein HED51_17505 [Ochrobactrum grignonense]|nr:hypothetical protein [Brucella grignonensis]